MQLAVQSALISQAEELWESIELQIKSMPTLYLDLIVYILLGVKFQTNLSFGQARLSGICKIAFAHDAKRDV